MPHAQSLGRLTTKLALEGIEQHRTTKVKKGPQSNGFVGRLHRTLLDEHFRIQGRKKWYNTVDKMQADLDKYLKHYNNERTHQGCIMNGGRLTRPSSTACRNPEKRR